MEIVKKGFDLSKCNRFRFGRGVYSTPCPNTAMKYARSFKYNEKSYKLVFQVRIDPEQLEVVKEKDEELGEYWLVPDGSFCGPMEFVSFP